MTPDRWKALEEIYDAATALPPGERAGYLDRACAQDTALRREVEQLFTRADETDNPFATLISEVAGSFAAASESGIIGRRLGPYRVTGAVGRGGMAEVFRAVRDDDEYRKEVAIKLLRQGMASGFMLSRFRHERQILASLEHPHIARFLDGGTTEDGIPYFVMEHIEGLPITEYCEVHRLSLKERLKLFRAVCAAVQHAHRNLIVHRDLKPSNILVTPEGVPKLLDFGIAKLLHPEVSSVAVTIAQTVPAMRLMTPEYASPEQVRGEPVTTATDVYSLGAVLYELLTGERPHKFKGTSLSEIEQVVCQAEIERPSAAAGRSTRASARLRRELSGDLDNVVLTALRKEPERRYQSAEQLAEDLRRYLEGRPVRARQDTVGYRASKFIRRHTAAVGAVVLLFFLLTGFGVTMSLQAARVARERDRANQVTDFLVRLFEVSSPGEGRGGEVTAREVLDQGAARVDRQLAGQPEVQAALMDTMGHVYRHLGLFESAEPLLEKALVLRQRTLGEEHPDVATSLLHLAELHHARGKLEIAERLYREALARRQSREGDRHPEVLAVRHGLGILLKDKGDYQGAEPLLRQTLEKRRLLFGAEHADVAATMHELGLVLKEKGDFASAEPFYREALAIRHRTLGESHPDVATSLNDLAVLLDTGRKYEEAERLYRESLRLFRQLYGEEHHYVATNLSNLAGVLKHQGRYEESASLYLEALALKRNRLGPAHAEVAAVLNNLGSLRKVQGDYRAAEAAFREALSIKRKSPGSAHPSTAITLHNLAEVLAAKGEDAEAEPLFIEALNINQQALPRGHWRTAAARSGYGSCLVRLGRFAQAEEQLQAAHDALTSAFPNGHERVQETIENLARLYEAWGRPAEAARYRTVLLASGVEKSGRP